MHESSQAQLKKCINNNNLKIYEGPQGSGFRCYDVNSGTVRTKQRPIEEAQSFHQHRNPGTKDSASTVFPAYRAASETPFEATPDTR